eukprot:7211135-Pyramimonas_sp.AAC.1
MGGLTAPEGGDEALTEASRCTAYFEVGGAMPRGSLPAEVGTSAPFYSCGLPRLIHDLVQEQ